MIFAIPLSGPEGFEKFPKSFIRQVGSKMCSWSAASANYSKWGLWCKFSGSFSMGINMKILAIRMWTQWKFWKLWSIRPFLEGPRFLQFRVISRSLCLIQEWSQDCVEPSTRFAHKCAAGQLAPQTIQNGASGANFQVAFRWTSTWRS